MESPLPLAPEPTPPKPAKELYVNGSASGMVAGMVDEAKDAVRRTIT